MDTIEIRPNRKFLLPFAGVLILALFLMNYLTFFTDYYNGRHFVWKILSAILSVSLLAPIHKLYKRIQTNQPFIIMSKTILTYHKNGERMTFLWSDITTWDISTEDSTTYLTIVAKGNKEKIGINWLDKTPNQINDLMRQFK